MRLAGLVTIAGFVVTATALLPANAFAADDMTDRPAVLQPPSRSAADTFSSIESPTIGLRPPPAPPRERIELPLGLNYSRDAKSLLLPIDDKNEWGVGINLNLNASKPVELSPPGLHLEPKRAPGLMLQKKF